jgi:hypothetical protein
MPITSKDQILHIAERLVQMRDKRRSADEKSKEAALELIRLIYGEGLLKNCRNVERFTKGK